MSRRVCFFFSLLVVIFAFDGDPPIIDTGGTNTSTPVHDLASISENDTEWTSHVANTGTLIGSTKMDVTNDTKENGQTTQAMTEDPNKVSRIKPSTDQPMNKQNSKGVNDIQTFFNVVGSIDKLNYQDVMALEDRLENVKKAKVKEFHHDEKEPQLPFGVEMKLSVNDEEVVFNFEKASHQVHSWVPVSTTRLVGQRSVWKHTTDETVELYCDNKLKICAAFILKLVNGHLLRFVLLNFKAGNKTFLIEPPVELLSSTKAEDSVRDIGPSTALMIKGAPHLMFEILPDDNIEDKRNLTISLIITADYSLFKKYLDIQGNIIEKARSKLLYDMITLGEEVSEVISRIPLNNTRLVAVVSEAKICEDEMNCQFSKTAHFNKSNTDGEVLLNNFRAVLEGQDKTWPANTMFIVFTENKIVVQGEIQDGYTDTSTDCLRPSAAVVTNQHPTRTVQSSAHQILQAFGVSKECVGEWLSRNLSASSICPIKALEEIAVGLDATDNNCLRGLDLHEARMVKPFDGKTPGQVHPLLEQCQLVFGPEASVCWPTDTATICQNLYCTMDNECRTLTGLKAMDGTSCAESSWCKTDLCQKDSRAPSMFEGGPKEDHCDSISTQLREVQEKVQSAKELTVIMAGLLGLLVAIAAVTVVLNVLLLKEKKLPRGHKE